MTRAAVSIAISIVAGFAAVYLLPPSWLGPLATIDAVCVGIFAIIVRFSTRTEPPADPFVGTLLSIVNLPEHPLAKVNEGWALRIFLASAVFLIALALAVIIRASS